MAQCYAAGRHVLWTFVWELVSCHQGKDDLTVTVLSFNLFPKQDATQANANPFSVLDELLGGKPPPGMMAGPKDSKVAFDLSQGRLGPHTQDESFPIEKPCSRCLGFLDPRFGLFSHLTPCRQYITYKYQNQSY